MPIALPCTISPDEVPGKLNYSVSLEDQPVSGEAEAQDLWLANGVKLGELPAGTVVDGYVAAEVEPSASVGALVSVVLPGGRRLVVRRASLQIIQDTGELENRGRRKKAV